MAHSCFCVLAHQKLKGQLATFVFLLCLDNIIEMSSSCPICEIRVQELRQPNFNASVLKTHDAVGFRHEASAHYAQALRIKK